MPELASEIKYQTTPDTSVDCRVYATFLRRNLEISAAELQSVRGLEELSVFHGVQQGTVFPVKSEEADILMKFIESRA